MANQCSRLASAGAIIVATIVSSPYVDGGCPLEAWSPVASLPGPRKEITSAVVAGQIYVFGDYNYSPLNNQAEVYDPVSDSWTPIADMLPVPASGGDGACGGSVPGRGQAAAAAVGNRIYLFGGNNNFSNCWLHDVDAYDIGTNSWIDGLAPIPGTGRGLLSAAAVNGKVYVMGGGNSYVVPTFRDNFIYDPKTNTWETGPQLPIWRSHHAAVALNGKIYLIGGTYRLMHGVPFSVPQVDVFDPSTGGWSQVAPLPTPRQQLSAVAFNGKIYAIGGLAIGPNGEQLGVTDIVEKYDPQSDSWQQVTPLPLPVAEGTAQVADGAIYVIGGVDDTGNDTGMFLDAVFVASCAAEEDCSGFPCGNNDNKVLLCHVPPGNPENAHTLCISPNAVAAHLDNHPDDHCGPCDDGSPRFQADVGTGDTGKVQPCPADVSGDGVTNVLDLIALLLCFGQPAVPGCEGEDINGDGVTNVLDLIEVLLHFGQTCP